MTRLMGPLLASLIVAAVAGCAEARLEIATDIYAEDVGKGEAQKQATLATEKQWQTVQETADEVQQIIADLAKLNALTEEAYLAENEPGKPYERGRNVEQFQAPFQEPIRVAAGVVANNARQLIKDLRADDPGPVATGRRELAFSIAAFRDTVRIILEQVSSTLLTDERNISGIETAASTEKVKELLQQIAATKQSLQERIQALRGSDSPEEIEPLDIADENFGEAAVEATKLYADETIEQAQREGIRSSARHLELLNSQVDRLQDPSDPALPILADSANDRKWRPFISNTTFYAQGNTSVVVVRERAGQYSVKHGVNNPSALIKGQLNISRTLASAALSFASAAAGVPLPTGALAGQTSPAVPEESAPATASPRNQALIDEAEILHRENARRHLQTVLGQLILAFETHGRTPRPTQAGLEQTQWDSTFNELKARTVTLLRSQERLFAKPEPAAQPNLPEPNPPAQPSPPAEPTPPAAAPPAPVETQPLPLTPPN